MWKDHRMLPCFTPVTFVYFIVFNGGKNMIFVEEETKVPRNYISWSKLHCCQLAEWKFESESNAKSMVFPLLLAAAISKVGENARDYV